MSKTNCPNPLGPITAWVREKWQGDKPYPRLSLAEKNVIVAKAATIRRETQTLDGLDRRLEVQKNARDMAVARAVARREQVSNVEEEADRADIEVDRMNGVVLEVMAERNEFLNGGHCD